MVVYTVLFVDAQGVKGQIVFPAVTELMARAWAELCHDSNKWQVTEMLNDNKQLVWSK